MYYQFEREESVQRPGKRAFGRANSGTVFQTAQLIDMFSVPLLLLFYADKTFLEPTLPTILSTVSEILLILHIFMRYAKHAYCANYAYLYRI